MGMTYQVFQALSFRILNPWRMRLWGNVNEFEKLNAVFLEHW